MHQSEFSWIAADNTQFYAIEWTPEAEPIASLTLVHGFGEHSNRYHDFAEYYCDHGFSVLAFDMRGHGKTTGKRGFIPSLNVADQDIQHFIDENRSRHPHTPQFLFGHSMGGAQVIHYSLNQPKHIKAVIAASPSIGVGYHVPMVKKIFAQTFAKLAPGLTLPNPLDINNLSHDAAVVEAYKKDPLVHHQISASLGWEMLNVGQKLIQKAKSLTIPILIVYGSDDQLISIQKLSEFTEQNPELIELKEYKGLYHETHNEYDREIVMQYEIDWLSKFF